MRLVLWVSALRAARNGKQFYTRIFKTEYTDLLLLFGELYILTENYFTDRKQVISVKSN